MPIQQGNYLQAADLDQLQNGMTRSQVKFLLGTPMIPSGFDSSRWDYYYFLKAARLKKPEQRKFTVYFENDKVTRVEREGAMEKAPESAPIRS
jgi:outer membrane protein assembly factor BamE